MKSLRARAVCTERPRLHRMFSDVGSGSEIGQKWRGEPPSGDPRVTYTCTSLALVSETLNDSNMSRLWAEIYSLSRRGGWSTPPRVRSMSHSHPHSHVRIQSHMLVNCGLAEVRSEAAPQPWRSAGGDVISHSAVARRQQGVNLKLSRD